MRAILAGLFLVLTTGWAMAGPQTSVADRLLGHYYAIQRSLASDSIAGVSASAAQMADLSRRAAGTETQAKTQLTALANSAARLRATDLKSARNEFGDLSDTLIAYLQTSKAKRNPPYQYYCSMVKKNWLQPGKEIRNPYYGNSMLTCGELVQPSQSAEQHTGHNHH
jgi:hypothetical protein